MSFVTKAVVATGATAVLALGGAGAIANFASSVDAAVAPSIVAHGHVVATGANCTPWAVAGGDAIEQAVPGTTAVSTCTVNIAGADANTQATVGLDASYVAPADVQRWFRLDADVQNLYADRVEFVTASAIEGEVGVAAPLVITITAKVPSAERAALENDGAAEELTEALSNVVVTFDQTPYLGIPINY